jgi:putative membrane protein
MPWGAGGSGLLPTLLWLVVIAAVVGALAYLVLRRLDEREPGERDPGRSDARAILETRYARGEIDDEEFERRRDRLAGGT